MLKTFFTENQWGWGAAGSPGKLFPVCKFISLWLLGATLFK